jgi:hypothetical protein
LEFHQRSKLLLATHNGEKFLREQVTQTIEDTCRFPRVRYKPEPTGSDRDFHPECLLLRTAPPVSTRYVATFVVKRKSAAAGLNGLSHGGYLEPGSANRVSHDCGIDPSDNLNEVPLNTERVCTESV